MAIGLAFTGPSSCASKSRLAEGCIASATGCPATGWRNQERVATSRSAEIATRSLPSRRADYAAPPESEGEGRMVRVRITEGARAGTNGANRDAVNLGDRVRVPIGEVTSRGLRTGIVPMSKQRGRPGCRRTQLDTRLSVLEKHLDDFLQVRLKFVERCPLGMRSGPTWDRTHVQTGFAIALDHYVESTHENLFQDFRR